MPNKSPRLRPHNFKSEIVFRGFVFEAGGALASYNVQANATQARPDSVYGSLVGLNTPQGLGQSSNRMYLQGL